MSSHSYQVSSQQISKAWHNLWVKVYQCGGWLEIASSAPLSRSSSHALRKGTVLPVKQLCAVLSRGGVHLKQLQVRSRVGDGL
jgi:hypothetical protein